MPISQSVGKSGGNIKHEVRYVQALLNVWRDHNRRPLLKMDGIADTKTIAAVDEFQQAKFGYSDGRVDPNAPTIRKLEEQITSRSRELKAYLMLAMVLSYDPEAENPGLSTTEFHNILSSMFPRG